MLAIRLPEEIEARLDTLAKRTGRSKTFYAGPMAKEGVRITEKGLVLVEQNLARY